MTITSRPIGKGGDCFVWGDGHSGQLGLGDFDNHEQAVVNNSFPAVMNVACGANHSVVQSEDGVVYCNSSSIC